MLLLDRTFDVSTTPLTPAPADPALAQEAARFIGRESRLLDERRFDDWLALWTNEGRYWMPRHHAQADPFTQISLFWEDRMLRETRVRRLLHPRNWSQQPPTRSSRLVGNLQVDGLDAAGHLIVCGTLHYVEYRLEQRVLAGQVFYKLARGEDGGFRLQLKRVNLVNCDSVFGNLEVFV